jgi:hypothetical protein
LLAACSTLLGETPVVSSPATSDGEATTTGVATGCVRFTGDHSSDIDTGALASDALFLSGEMFICADDVVVVAEGDLNQIAAAAQLAAAISGPLLFPEPRLAAELGRLKPQRVHLVGSPLVNVPDSADTLDHDVTSAVQLAQERLGVADSFALPPVPDASTVVETALAIGAGNRVTLPQQTDPDSTTIPTESVVDPAEVVVGLAIPSEAEALWMVDAAKPETILLAAAVGRAIEATVVAIDGQDILGYPEVGAAVDGHPPETLRYVGSTADAGDWELAVLANGQQVPGGGFYILPREGQRRYVAYYGHPETTDLGVLGEQGPAETRAAMQGFVEAYAGDGSAVIPTFEIIVSVASAGPTEDDDTASVVYRDVRRMDQYARANDMYVMLDLQSGRDDFPTGGAYEELLKLPFVGLALDPGVASHRTAHLNQTGTVDAAEVNETVNWVADLVRDNGLPQKMMMVHQFKASMITNRDDIIERPEIQMIIQMDGDGTEADKNRTWAILQEGAQDVHWAWGWKNFFDEDEPEPPSPESTMGKVPTPVYVSYQ